jgi:hypothetical protein
MADIKHVGRIKTTGRKCLVAFRTLPGESNYCLVIPTENLEDQMHDSLISLVESPAGQASLEFADILARAKFSDGSTMLPSLHAKQKLVKVATDQVEMLPNFQTRIDLSELNQLIAEQQGVSVNDLAVKDPVKADVEVVDIAKVRDISPSAKTTSASVTEESQPVMENLSTEDQAKRFRSEADKLSKLAAEMRRQAELLLPTKKAK